MNTSGEAADQVVRMTLNGVEVLLKVSGKGAAKLAAFLYAALKDNKKTRGRTRLESMLRSGKPLSVFSVKKDELPLFTQEAKRYGILYCGLKSKLDGDGMYDIMVKAEDSAKLNRIVEKLKHATAPSTSVVAEFEKRVSEKEAINRDVKTRDATQILVDKIIVEPGQKEQAETANPTMATTAKSPPSEPYSKNLKQDKGDENRERPSVRKALADIKKAQQEEMTKKPKDKTPLSTTPVQRQNRKSKPKSKER